MKKEGKEKEVFRETRKKKKKKLIIILIIAIVIILTIFAYFLFFNKSSIIYIGFSNPEYSPSGMVGSILGTATESNPWEDVKLNPFENETT